MDISDKVWAPYWDACLGDVPGALMKKVMNEDKNS